MITMVAHQRDDPNAVISAIDYDQLNDKQFKRTESKIDPPVTYEVNQGEARTEAGDESTTGTEDVIIDSKKLYKNFVDLVESQQLKFVSQSTAKRDGISNQLKDD